MDLEWVCLGGVLFQLAILELAYRARGGRMTQPKDDLRQLVAAGGNAVEQLSTNSEGVPVTIPSPAGGTREVEAPSPGGPGSAAPLSEERLP